jgi:hypothetical protein
MPHHNWWIIVFYCHKPWTNRASVERKRTLHMVKRPDVRDIPHEYQWSRIHEDVISWNSFLIISFLLWTLSSSSFCSISYAPCEMLRKENSSFRRIIEILKRCQVLGLFIRKRQMNHDTDIEAVSSRALRFLSSGMHTWEVGNRCIKTRQIR